MNLTQLNNIMEEEDWANKEGPITNHHLKQKIAAFQHEAEVMLHKLHDWPKRAPMKVFVTTTKKNAPGGTAAKVPPAVSTDSSKFLTWTIIDTIGDNGAKEQLITRIYVTKSDVALARKIRNLVDRHNNLSNQQAVFAGMLVGGK